jgi:UDP-2,3-diacylglucosamine pyrophosphatase LpxH
LRTEGSLKRLTSLYRSSSAHPIEIDQNSRMVFMADSHRGNGGRGDDFAHNRLIFLHALAWYRNNGYTYTEVGDGEELWENGGFDAIHWAYSDIYIRLGYLHSQGRLLFIWGNHNNIWRRPEAVSRKLMPALCFYYDGRPSPLLEGMNPETARAVIRGELPPPESRPLLKTLEAKEAVTLRHGRSGLDILVTHGHQGEFWSDRLWRLSRFLVRRVWRFLQNAGMRPRITPAGNYALMKQVENRLTAWTKRTGVALITGHTHQPEFPSPGREPYFNCGSSVHPRCITAIEIHDESISLVKWHVSTPLASGTGTSSTLEMEREVLEGPVPLQEYTASARSGHRQFLETPGPPGMEPSPGEIRRTAERRTGS